MLITLNSERITTGMFERLTAKDDPRTRGKEDVTRWFVAPHLALHFLEAAVR